MESSKICFKCKIELPLLEFYKHSQMTDGYLGKCKECTKKDVSENYYAHIDDFREYEKKRRQAPNRKANALEYQRRQRAKNPEKDKARKAVQRAIAKGEIVRRPCQTCGNPKSEAHHADYSKPLEVQWLCFGHHREAHGHRGVF